MLVIMAGIYWCVSKEFGTYLLMGWTGSRVVNGLLKVTACVYRPWIRDPRRGRHHHILRPADVLRVVFLSVVHETKDGESK